MHYILIFSALLSACHSRASRSAPTSESAAEQRVDKDDASIPEPPESPAENKTNMPNLVLRLKTPQLLEGGDEFELSTFVIEQIEASGVEGDAYPAGSGIVFTVRAGEEDVELASLSAPYSSLRIGWTSRYRIELIDLDDSQQSVSLRVDRLREELVAGWEERVHITKDETVMLKEGTAIRFDGHGHKFAEPGVPTPLIVGLTLERKDEGGQEQASWNVFYPDEPGWQWRDLVFVLEKYEYGESMDLWIRRRQLEPVAVSGG